MRKTTPKESAKQADPASSPPPPPPHKETKSLADETHDEEGVSGLQASLMGAVLHGGMVGSGRLVDKSPSSQIMT